MIAPRSLRTDHQSQLFSGIKNHADGEHIYFNFGYLTWLQFLYTVKTMSRNNIVCEFLIQVMGRNTQAAVWSFISQD